MDYKRLWDDYINIKNTFSGKAFSSHTQIRRALLRQNRNQNIILERNEEIYLVDSYDRRITTLTDLLLSQPPEVYIKEKVLWINIYRSTNGEISVSRKIYKKRIFNQDPGMKEIEEEVFWYLWEKTETGIDRLFLDLRLITPSIIRKTNADEENITLFKRVFERAGMKLISIPRDVPDYLLLDNPFVFDDKILYTQDSLEFLKALKEERLSKGYKIDYINKLLDLWKSDNDI